MTYAVADSGYPIWWLNNVERNQLKDRFLYPIPFQPLPRGNEENTIYNSKIKQKNVFRLLMFQFEGLSNCNR